MKPTDDNLIHNYGREANSPEFSAPSTTLEPLKPITVSTSPVVISPSVPASQPTPQLAQPPANNSDLHFGGSVYTPTLETFSSDEQPEAPEPPVVQPPPVISPELISSAPDTSLDSQYPGSTYNSSLESSPTGLTPVVGMSPIASSPLTPFTPSTSLTPPRSTTIPPLLPSAPPHSDRFSAFNYNRKALLITTVVVSLMLVVGLATYFFGSHTTKSSTTTQNSSTISSQYAVSNLPLSSSSITSQLKVGTAEQLTINGQLLVNDTVILAPGTAPIAPVTGQLFYDQSSNQPYYYNGKQFISLQPTQVTPTPVTASNVCIQSATNCGFAVAGSGVTTINGLASSLTIANTTGTGTTITIQDASTTQKGIAQFNTTNFTSTAGVIDTIQGITTTSDVRFASLGLGTTSTTGNLTLSTSGSLIANSLTHTGTGNNITLNAGADNISFTNGSGSNTFFLPTSGGIGQVICTTAITCAAGGGQAVILEPSGIQSANSNLDALAINKASGTGNLLKLQTAGVDAFVVNASGNTTISNTTTISSLQTNSLTPTSALTIGSTTQSFTLQGNASSTISATNAGSTTAISFITPTANVNYQFATAAAGTYSVCTTAVVCAGYTPSSGSSSYLQLQATTPGSAQTGNSNITGTSIAGISIAATFSGSGINLTNLNGSNISSGTVADARLTTNVTLLGNTFNGANQLVQLTAGGILPALNGSNLTSLNASNLSSGTVSDSRLSANVALLNGTGPQTFTGNNKFTGTVLSKNASDSTSAFQVQNSAGTAVLTTDTTNQRVSVGSIGTATAQLYVAGMLPTTTNTLVTGSTNAQFFAVVGRYAYITNNATSNFMIIDTTRPATMAVISTTTTTGMSSPYAVAVAGKYAYITNNADTTNAYGLEILDISNPSAPVLIGHIGTNAANTGGARQLVVQGRYVFLINAVTNTIQSFDVANPAAPVALTTQSTGGSPISITIQGRYAYVTNQGASSFTVFDISNPSSIPAGTAWTTATTTPIPIAVSGRYAYVMSSTSASSFQVFDISNPTTPAAAIGSTTGGSSPVSLYVQGRYAYVAYNAGNFQVFDISNPTAPSSIGTYATGLTSVAGLTVSGRYAYITASTGISSLDLGGTYSQQLEAGGIETSTLQVNGNANLGSNVSIAGALQLAQSLQVSGNIGSSGSVLFQNATNSTSAFKVQNAAGTAILNVDTTNGFVGIGTTTPQNKLSVNGNASFGATDNAFIGPSQYGGLELPRGELFFSNTNVQNQLYAMSNAYVNAAGTFNYRNTAVAAGMGIDTGVINFLTAGSGTAGNPITFTTAMDILNNGNVGIGTTAPAARLQIDGGGAAALPPTSGTTVSTGEVLRLRSTDVAGGILDIGSATNQFWLQSTDATSLGTGYQLLLNPNGGNVGIGTTAPGNTLTITQTSGSDTLPALGSNGGRLGLINADVAGGPLKYGLIGGVLSNGFAYLQDQRVDGNVAVYSILLQPNGGNVGIGTSSPAYTLDVSGTIRSNPSNGEGFNSTNDTIGRDFYTGKGTLGTLIGYAGTAAMVQGSNASQSANNNLSLQPYGGNVGIGTTTPATRLDVSGGITARADAGGQALRVVGRSGDNFAWGPLAFQNDGTTYTGGMYYTPTAVTLAAGSGLTTVMTWLPSGYVGIGTTGPGAYLTVQPAGTGSTPLLNVINTGNNSGGANWTAFIHTDQNFNVATTAYTGAALEVTTYPNASANNSGDTLRVGTGDGSGGNFYPQFIVKASTGNVGIGTATPANRLTVISPIIGGTVSVASSQIYARGSDNGYGLAIGALNSPAGGYLQAMVNDVPSLPLFLNPSGGNVSIGNAVSPAHTLGVTGTIGASGTITASTTPDISETIPAAPDVVAADVVMADPNNTERVVKSDKAYASAVVGVISDGSSSFMINSYGHSESAGLTGKPLVLAGRVPVHITNEGGPISPGDYLTASSTPGYAMKATHAGPTIGKSYGFFNSPTNGTVLAMINVSYYDPSDGQSIQANNAILNSLTVNGATNTASINVGGLATVKDLTVTGNATIGGNLTITGSLTVTGPTIVADITVNGHIITAGNAPQVLAAVGAGVIDAIHGISAPVVTVSGNDTTGTISFVAGANGMAGDVANLTFNKVFGNAPRVTLTSVGSNSAKLQTYLSNATTTGFTIGSNSVPVAGTTYTYNYQIMQ